MKKLMFTLIAAGMSVAFGALYAADAPKGPSNVSETQTPPPKGAPGNAAKGGAAPAAAPAPAPAAGASAAPMDDSKKGGTRRPARAAKG